MKYIVSWFIFLKQKFVVSKRQYNDLSLVRQRFKKFRLGFDKFPFLIKMVTYCALVSSGVYNDEGSNFKNICREESQGNNKLELIIMKIFRRQFQ